MAWSTSHAARVVREGLLREMNEALSLLEAQKRLPGDAEGRENARIRNAIERDMAAYFRGIDDALPEDRLTELYYKWVEMP